MRHDQTAGLQTGKIQPGQESPKLPQILKNSKTIKIIFFSGMAWYIWLKFCMEYLWDLGVSDIKMKKSVAK